MAEEYASNSHKSKMPVPVVESPLEAKPKSEQLPAPTKKVEKVIKGTAIAKKRSPLKRIAENLIAEDIQTVKEHLFLDVFLPAIKDTIYDLFTNGIEMMLYGETSRKKGKRNGRSWSPYDGMFNKNRMPSSNKPNDTRAIESKRMASCDDIILDDRGDAEEVLSRMQDMLEEYGSVSVADLYDLMGWNTSFTDNKYGWYDLSGCSVTHVRGGWEVSLPNPVQLN